MSKQRGFKQVTLRDRLAAWVNEVRNQAARLPPGPEREALLKKARQADTASHLDEWVNSGGIATTEVVKPVCGGQRQSTDC